MQPGGVRSTGIMDYIIIATALFGSLFVSQVSAPFNANTNIQGKIVRQIGLLQASNGGAKLIGRLDRNIPRLMREGNVPGLSIVLIRNSRAYWYRGFGVKNADTNEPVDGQTVFETASLTKPVLAYAALKLVDSGKLQLDAPLTKYLPGNYAKDDSRSALITARMVLSHTTGFQNEIHSGEQIQIHFTPGERFSYSGEGFIYLQKVIERISGERLDVFMKKTVFDPLGLKSASYLWRKDYAYTMANGHNAAGIPAERIWPTELKLSWLHMTALDYAKFVIAVMNGTGLKPESARIMLTPQIQVNEGCVFCLKSASGRMSQSLSWGLGWGLERTETGDAFFHWGENRGEFHTFVVAYPKQKTAVVIFTNSGNGLSIIPEIVSQAIGGSHPAFTWMGYQLYSSPEFKQRQTELRAAVNLYKAVLADGKAGLEQYRNTRKALPAEKVLSERRINSVGYWLLGKKKIKEALEVFKMNVEDHPKSADAYDSLGEAYMVAGNKAEAIKNYQRSLDLNPANDNARQMLLNLERQ